MRRRLTDVCLRLRQDMRSAVGAVILLMLAPVLSGCFGGDDVAPKEPDSVFDALCPDGIARNVW